MTEGGGGKEQHPPAHLHPFLLLSMMLDGVGYHYGQVREAVLVVSILSLLPTLSLLSGSVVSGEKMGKPWHL